MTRHLACGALATLLLASCASAPTPEPAQPRFDAPAAVRAIRAAGTADATELDVQPLRDPQVEDLRSQAAAAEGRGGYAAAADALDRALAINRVDPALLQERAEVALLAGDAALADRLAREALAAGSRVGPLCRRHWETVAQAAMAASPAGTPVAAIADARRQRDACTVAPPARY